VATCLAWNGHSNPPTHMAITAAQALQIAANPAWGAGQMSAALVRDAATGSPACGRKLTAGRVKARSRPQDR
jgi:hypothetical protein